MSKRRALLIGVPKYRIKDLLPLPFIKNDIRRLQGALESSGFHVLPIGLDRIPATPGEILGEISAFCREAINDDELLICFSGHGVNFDGESYLVPYDARVDDRNLKRYLISVEDFRSDFENSKAKTILFFVDACRQGIDLRTDTMAIGLSPFKPWPLQKLQLSKDREVAFIFSCQEGEVSRFVRGPTGFSLFSRALAETFHIDSPAATFREVIEEIQRRLDELADKNDKPRQTIKISSELGPGDLRLFDRVIFDKPNRINPESWLIKGLELHGLGKYNEAILSYNKSIEIDPKYVRAWLNKGLAFHYLGKYNESINCYDKALEIDPNCAAAWNNKGSILYMQNRFNESFQAYDRANKIDPKCPNPWIGKGNIFTVANLFGISDSGRKSQARQCYKKAVEIDPKNSQAWYNMGLFFYMENQYQRAIECYDMVIELSPKDALVQHIKGNALKKLGLDDEASECFKKARDLGFDDK
jgi:Tfp pilus assembly protein PilF